MTKSYYIETYGCQMNVRDSEIIAGILEECGYVSSSCKEDSSLILFNTCCVREHAEKKVYGNVGALCEYKSTHPDAIIGICGCMMQQKRIAERTFRRFPFVDLIIGTNQLHRIPEFLDAIRKGNRVLSISDDLTEIEERLPSKRSVSINPFVNIAYGCNNYCTYCIVPYVRGPERSRQPEAILEEVQNLVQSGASEITLLGQNVNSYGSDLGNISFSDLLYRVSAINGLKRIRFMTSHPKDLSDQLINTVAELPNVCHHVHLPLQSGSDRILKLMNRHYDMNRYYSIVDKLRSSINDIEITTDLIVGFPGETDMDFAKTIEAVNSIAFSSAYTFKFSPRQGTAAAKMPDQIPENIKKERLSELNAIQQAVSEKNNQKYIGTYGIVHVEGCDMRRKPLYYGKLSNFKMIYFEAEHAEVGDYLPVEVTGVRRNALSGRLLKDECN